MGKKDAGRGDRSTAANTPGDENAISRLYTRAQQAMWLASKGHLERTGFEDGAGEDSLIRLAEIAAELSRNPAATIDEVACKIEIWRALADEDSLDAFGTSADGKLLLSLLEDIERLKTG